MALAGIIDSFCCCCCFPTYKKVVVSYTQINEKMSLDKLINHDITDAQANKTINATKINIQNIDDKRSLIKAGIFEFSIKCLALLMPDKKEVENESSRKKEAFERFKCACQIAKIDFDELKQKHKKGYLLESEKDTILKNVIYLQKYSSKAASIWQNFAYLEVDKIFDLKQFLEFKEITLEEFNLFKTFLNKDYRNVICFNNLKFEDKNLFLNAAQKANKIANDQFTSWINARPQLFLSHGLDSELISAPESIGSTKPRNTLDLGAGAGTGASVDAFTNYILSSAEASTLEMQQVISARSFDVSTKDQQALLTTQSHEATTLQMPRVIELKPLRQKEQIKSEMRRSAEATTKKMPLVKLKTQGGDNLASFQMPTIAFISIADAYQNANVFVKTLAMDIKLTESFKTEKKLKIEDLEVGYKKLEVICQILGLNIEKLKKEKKENHALILAILDFKKLSPSIFFLFLSLKQIEKIEDEDERMKQLKAKLKDQLYETFLSKTKGIRKNFFETIKEAKELVDLDLKTLIYLYNIVKKIDEESQITHQEIYLNYCWFEGIKIFIG